MNFLSNLTWRKVTVVEGLSSVQLLEEEIRVTEGNRASERKSDWYRCFTACVFFICSIVLKPGTIKVSAPLLSQGPEGEWKQDNSFWLLLDLWKRAHIRRLITQAPMTYTKCLKCPEMCWLCGVWKWLSVTPAYPSIFCITKATWHKRHFCTGQLLDICSLNALLVKSVGTRC